MGFDVVHLSCHGENDKDGPRLLLEDAEGNEAPASAAALAAAFGETKPALVFLSACQTAQHRAGAAALARELLRAGVPAVMGWDGSVRDIDATEFATRLYKELAGRQRPAYAAAMARQQLLEKHVAEPERKTCRHWHLARLYVGASGGGPLCVATGSARTSHRGRAHRVFLDRKGARVPVAAATAFVGRRREAQAILRTFRDPARAMAGVLIHGFGGQGKSSLAARIADRMPQHVPAVVYEHYDALPVFNAALEAVDPQHRGALRQRWGDAVQQDAATLRDALEDILTGPAAVHNPAAHRQPILLIIDDLERALEPPAPGVEAPAVKAHCAAPLRAVIEAFRNAETQARLLLTSRFPFALRDGTGAELGEKLHRLHLRPFDEQEQAKQQRMARGDGDAAPLKPAEAEEQKALFARVLAVAKGNPLLLDKLTRVALAEPKAASAAIAAMEAYLAGGAAPSGAELADEFRRLAFQSYRQALAEAEAEAFRALTLFQMPVPDAACAAAAGELAGAKAGAALARLAALGLVDTFEAAPPASGDEVLANMLARPLFAALTENEQARIAGAALPSVMRAWCDDGGNLPADRRALEAYNLATLAEDAASLGNAALWGALWLFRAQHDARTALPLVRAALDALHAAGIKPHRELLRLGIVCADRLGEADLQDELLEQAGGIKGADEFSNALLWGHKADRLLQKGDLDEAWRIRREEQLPVYEWLGDVRERAVTMGRIADILMSRGDLDEALRIRREEELPVYDRLGDVRQRTVTKGKIADILMSRGDVDEALRILEQERLPAAEKLGDVEGVVVVLVKTARIRRAKGIDSQEASDRVLGDLRQAYALAKKLTRLDFICAVADDLGQLLAGAGAADEARPLLTEARDGYAKLGLARHVAKMDQILQQFPPPANPGD